MIFDTNYSRYDDNVNPSPYDLNMEGALMLVYETELNYNNIMKAVGVSELKYYQETGKDLFITEAGAFKGFLGKIKEFFQNIIKKIKEIFAKFVLLMKKNTSSDKKFIEKFEKVYTGNMGKIIKYNGYTFENLNDYIDYFTNPSNIEFLYDEIKRYDLTDDKFDYRAVRKSHIKHNSYDEDSKNTIINKYRGKILDDGNTEYTSDEFKKKLHEKCYGEKKELEAIVSDHLNYIKATNNSISRVEKVKNNITKNIETIISMLEKIDEKNQAIDDEESVKKEKHKKVLDEIEILKSQSQDIMVVFSSISHAVKDRATQAKSICIKALGAKDKSSKEESAIYDNDNVIQEAGLQDMDITPQLLDDKKYVQQLIDIINKTPKEDYKKDTIIYKLITILEGLVSSVALFIPGVRIAGLILVIMSALLYAVQSMGLNDVKRVNMLIDRLIKKFKKKNDKNPSPETEKMIKKLEDNKKMFNEKVKNEYFKKSSKEKTKKESAICDDIFSDINII